MNLDWLIYRMKIIIYFLKKLLPSRMIRRHIRKKMRNMYPPKEYKLQLLNIDEKEHIEDYEKIAVPYCANPEISIIIPVYNQFDFTYNCVKSIVMNTEKHNYEIIVADDCSNDKTQNIQKVVANLKLCKNEKNKGFLKNCNDAVNYAKGKYLVFLNNDTQVLNNWLEPMKRILDDNPNIGMTGAKLVYPNGVLQEAGGVIYKDGSAANFGNGCDPFAPLFNQIRDVDYISGAAIMIRGELWNQIGGFDVRYMPAYYEDTDLAFMVRQMGYRVVLQPESVVIHFEGVSNGNIVKYQTIKYYQILNEKKFCTKWKKILRRYKKYDRFN